jgi:hypothetical protein
MKRSRHKIKKVIEGRKKERQFIVNKINKLLPVMEENRPKIDRRFVKNDDGKIVTKRFWNTEKNKKYVKAHNEVRELREHIYSYVPEPKLKIAKNGDIVQVKD